MNARALLSMFCFAFALSACAASQRAAARDPQRCERDPECASKQGKHRDCTSQCVDNIECMERCEQIRRQVSP